MGDQQKKHEDPLAELGTLRSALDALLAAEFKGTELRSDAIAKMARARTLLADLIPAAREAFACARR